MTPFINIHTHQIGSNSEDIVITDWFTASHKSQNILGYFSAGLHPWFIDATNFNLQFHEIQSIASNFNCKAIGECGLDKNKGPAMDLQIQLFEQQINLAIQVKKPVIVHCVKAFDLLIPIIKKYQNRVLFIVHGFNQNEQIANQLIEKGVYLSFGAALLNSKNKRLKLIFSQSSNAQIFLENDAADSTIQKIFEAAASIKKCDVDMMKEVIFANYKTVFTNE